MTNVYDIGDLVESSVVFTDADGNAVDPTTVVVKYQDPALTETTKTYVTDAAVVKDAVGRYHINISVTAAVPASLPATWFVRWLGTGAAQAAYEGSFTVRASQF